MGWQLHTRKNDNDEFRYRVWSTVTDSYITDVLTQDDLRLFMLIETVIDAVTKLIPADSREDSSKTFEEFFKKIKIDWIEKSENKMDPTMAQAPWDTEKIKYEKPRDGSPDEWIEFKKILMMVNQNLHKAF